MRGTGYNRRTRRAERTARANAKKSGAFERNSTNILNYVEGGLQQDRLGTARQYLNKKESFIRVGAIEARRPWGTGRDPNRKNGRPWDPDCGWLYGLVFYDRRDWALCTYGLTPTTTLLFCFILVLPVTFTRSKMSSHDNDELIDYEDENDVVPNGATAGGAADDDKEKKNFSGIHSTGFRLVILYEFLLLFALTAKKVISY